MPAKVASRIKKAAGTLPVSAWVRDVIEDRLNDAELERQWREFYRDVRPSRKDVSRAEAMLKRLTARSSSKGAA